MSGNKVWINSIEVNAPGQLTAETFEPERAPLIAAQTSVTLAGGTLHTADRPTKATADEVSGLHSILVSLCPSE